MKGIYIVIGTGELEKANSMATVQLITNSLNFLSYDDAKHGDVLPLLSDEASCMKKA